MNEIVFGGIYRVKDTRMCTILPSYCNRLNYQKYNYWFPIRVKNDKQDCIYMIDTYQFEMAYKYKDNYNLMVDYLKSLGNEEDNSWLVYKTSNYYYTARVKIDKNNIEHFELLANLEDYEIVGDKEKEYYSQKDVLRGVMFWNYHRSGRGVSIKKKNAVLNYKLKIEQLYYDVLRDISSPHIYGGSVDKLLTCEKEAINKNAQYDKGLVEYAVKIEKYINKMEKNYKAYAKRLRKMVGIEE